MSEKCRNCKEDALPNRKYCQKHLDYINKKAKERVGKCKQCNEPAVDGKSRCAKHQEEVRIKSAERKAKLKANGLCRNCGKPVFKGLTQCEECNSKSVVNSKLKTIKRQLENKCTCCGKEKENKDKAFCDKCSEKDRQRLIERKDKAKENGICTRCRKNNSIDGGSFCNECYKAAREYFKKYTKQKFLDGICYRCKNPRVDGKIYCHSCKIDNSIRKAIIRSLRKKQIPKSAKTEEILGCTIAFFRDHIKNLMEPWMNEDNYGVHIPGEKRWQLGHKIPIAAFDLSYPEQLKKAWHYTNIIPQEAEENIVFQDFLFVGSKLVRGRDLR